MREECAGLKRTGKRRRITPAHAGRIASSFDVDSICEDHPRACGKNQSTPFQVLSVLGSPPRMREELPDTITVFHAVRITPAHAGRMGRIFIGSLYDQDHPRACGKNSVDEDDGYFV